MSTTDEVIALAPKDVAVIPPEAIDPTDPETDVICCDVAIVVPVKPTVEVGDFTLAQSNPAPPVELTSSLRPAVVG